MSKKKNMYKLESLARLISGRTPEREQKEYYAETGTPWVKIENLDQGYIRETAEYLSEQGKEKVNLVPENSVLFSIVGTVGKVGIAGRELATNQQIVSLIFDETRVLPLYGYYALRYHAEEIRKLSNQTTMALISRKTLGQYRIYVPDSLEKQQEIVDKLRRFEEIKLKKEEMRSRMEQYEQVLFQRIFASQLRYGDKARLRNYLKEPVGTGIPKNEEPNGEFPCVRLENFRKTYLTGLHAGEKAEVNAGADWAIEEKYRVCPGDILLRNGKLILVDRVEDPLYLDRSVLRIVPDQGQILPEALYAYLSQSCMSEVLYGARKEGDNRKRPIRAAEVEKLILPQLSMKKQEDYSRCLKKIREIERNLDREIALAEAAFSGMGWLLLRKEPEEEAKTDAISIEDIEIVTKAETEESTGKDLETMADAKTSEGAAGEAEQTEAGLQEEKSKVVSGKTGKRMQRRPVELSEEQKQTAHLILGVLCCWAPRDERTGAYCKKRQEIFRIAQPYFQPAAVSFTDKKGQREYLLEKDFLTYRNEELSKRYATPMYFLQKLLQESENDNPQDAHLAFQGEDGIATDELWDSAQIRQMAVCGWEILMEYSGLGACGWLVRGENGK